MNFQKNCQRSWKERSVGTCDAFRKKNTKNNNKKIIVLKRRKSKCQTCSYTKADVSLTVDWTEEPLHEPSFIFRHNKLWKKISSSTWKCNIVF